MSDDHRIPHVIQTTKLAIHSVIGVMNLAHQVNLMASLVFNFELDECDLTFSLFDENNLYMRKATVVNIDI